MTQRFEGRHVHLKHNKTCPCPFSLVGAPLYVFTLKHKCVVYTHSFRRSLSLEKFVTRIIQISDGHIFIK